ncbi:hypothetical protein LWI28_011293 [Acer negundo]|uniref:Cupin type-1 domain-containing protein n=1 Tax=Acer negundo TaxID=4023 RepID=A0AAD5NVF8_ACENE|nr:hypothetical protein LWI28_011293 [Acer negundo]
MKGVQFLVAFVVLALASSFASASDPSPLQDFCVAIDDYKSGVFVNGKFCKDPKLATPNDLFFSGLNIPKDTSNPIGSNVTQEGTLYVGFVTSNPENKLFTKVLNKGDVFVFPVGLIHFQFNIGKTNAVAFAGLSSQNPGVITIANAVFGSDPPTNPDFLARAFKLDQKVVKSLQAKFCYTASIFETTKRGQIRRRPKTTKTRRRGAEDEQDPSRPVRRRRPDPGVQRSDDQNHRRGRIEKLQSINSETLFDRIVAEAQQLQEPLIIDWTASWCRKCIYLKPKLEKLAANYYPRRLGDPSYLALS